MAAALLLALGLTLASTQAAAQSPPPIPLAAAVAQAKVSSPLRGEARSLAEGTAEAARLSGRPLNPVIEARSENFGITSTPLPLDVWLLVGQPLELGGKRSARLGVAQAERDVAASSLGLVDRQIALRTIQLYVQALRARGVVESLTVNREGLFTLITSVSRRVEEGYSPESDLLRFETEAARIDIEVARATLDLERSLATLGMVIGAPTPIVASQLVEPGVPSPPTADAAMVASAVASHPEVAAAQARVERARRARALEEARRLPDPFITTGYKRTAGFNAAEAGVTMSIPLFDRNGVAIARASGEERAAAADRAAIERRLTAEITALLDASRTLSARALRVSQELLEPATGVRNAALATFREGTADVLKLIDAERVFADVRRAALELRLEALNTTLEARFALGLEDLP